MLGWTLTFAAITVAAFLLSCAPKADGWVSWALRFAAFVSASFMFALIFALTTPAPADEPTTDLSEGTRVELDTMPAASGKRVEW